MVIEEKTKKTIKLLLRFLKQKNLLVEYKKDLNIKNKLEYLNIKCDESITLEEFIQIRLDMCHGDKNKILETIFDKTLIYGKCNFCDWGSINNIWYRFFKKNESFLK